MHKFRVDFLHAIYFTVTISLSTLQLKKKITLAVYPLPPLKSKAPLKGYILLNVINMLLSSVICLQILPWLGQKLCVTFWPHIFHNKKQILILVCKFCQYISLIFWRRKLCSKFLNRTAQSQACELMFRQLDIVRFFEIWNDTN